MIIEILTFFEKHSKPVIIGLLILGATVFIDRTLAVGLMFSFFLVALTLFIVNKKMIKEQKRIIFLIFLIAFVSHFALALCIYYLNFQPFSEGHGDYNDYHLMAKTIAERLKQGNFSLQNLPLTFGASHYYPVIIAYVYLFTLPSMLMGQIFNTWILSLTVVLVYFTVLELGRSQREAFWVSMLANLYPSLAFFGALMLKDVLIVFFSALSLLFAIKIIKKFSWTAFFLLYTGLFGLTHFRFYVAYALVAAFIITFGIFSALQFKKRLAYLLIMLFCFELLPQITGLGEGYFGVNSFARYLNINAFTYYREVIYAPEGESHRQEIATPEPRKELIPAGIKEETTSKTPWGEDSSIVRAVNSKNPTEFIKNNMLAFLDVLLGPYLWQLTQPKHFLLLPEIISWYIILLFVGRGIIRSMKTQYKTIALILIFSLFVLGGFSLFITNFGVSVRIRIPVFLALLCFLPFGLEKLKTIKIPLLEKNS